MSWIKIIEPDEATGELKRMYERIRGPGGQVDNILKSHSMRLHTLKGHMALYKSVLHHRGNSLPKWMLESIGLQVSLLNECTYCIEHHFAGLKKLHSDNDFVNDLRTLLAEKREGEIDDVRLAAMFAYVRQLTLQPAAMSRDLITRLSDVGFDDGEILEINQVAAYFAYANRTVHGLGVNHEGEVLGLSPTDDNGEENWNH